jgi:hypothetical protein
VGMISSGAWLLWKPREGIWIVAERGSRAGLRSAVRRDIESERGVWIRVTCIGSVLR